MNAHNPSRTILALLLLLGLASCSSDKQAQVVSQDKPSYIMGGDLNYYPYTFINDSNQASGLDVRLMRAISEELNVDIQIVLGTWSQMLSDLDSSKIDIMPMFITKQRSEKYKFSKPYQHRHYVLFGSADAEYIQSIEAVSGKTIYVQAATAGHEWLSQNATSANIVAVDDMQAMHNKISASSRDYIFNEESQFRSFQKKLDLKILSIRSPPLVSFDYAFATRLENKELIQLINIGIKNISNSGQMDDIKSIYEDELNPRSFLFYLISYVFLFLLILSIAYLSYYYRKGIKEVSGTLKNEAEKRMEAEKNALYLKSHDAFTGLPNRKRLKNKLHKITTDNPGLYTCLIQLSILDYFELFISAGEAACNNVEKNLAKLIKQHNVYEIGSLSPGKLGIILNPCTNNNELLERCKRLFESVNTTISIDNIRFDIRCCFGIVIYPDHTDDVEKLFRHAYLAHAHAINSANHYSIYDKDMEPDPKSIRLLSDFKQSMVDDEFILHYQPKLDLRNSKITGAEILVRWNHHEFGFLPPISFIPLLENTGLIKELTCHIMAKAIEKQVTLIDSGLLLSINVSTKDLTDHDFIETALSLKKHFNTFIMLEITETSFTKDYKLFLNNVLTLKEHGFHFSIDDYGTGYSSMQYLRDIKPYELKIDQSFIKNINNSNEDEILVSSTVKMAKELSSSITAEGVEDMHIAQKIKQLECDFAQGYGIAKPMDENSFTKWLEQPGGFRL